MADKLNEQFRRLGVASSNASVSLSSAEEDIGNLIFLKSVNIKTVADTSECFIVAIAGLSKHLLAVADCNNKCVKLIDYNIDSIKGTLQLANHPLSMTRLPQDQLAVTIANLACINIIATLPDLRVIKTIRVDSFCNDIAYFDGKLLVSVYDPLLKFQILDMTGKVLEKIVPGPDVTSSSTIESFIAFKPKDARIFISDFKHKICMSVDMNGKKMAECRELITPTGIACSPDLPYIFVCDRDKHLIRKLTIGLRCEEIVLNKSDGLLLPYALCFSPEQRVLVVSCMANVHGNNLRIYRC